MIISSKQNDTQIVVKFANVGNVSTTFAQFFLNALHTAKLVVSDYLVFLRIT